jgi:hypothetical protein
MFLKFNLHGNRIKIKLKRHLKDFHCALESLCCYYKIKRNKLFKLKKIQSLLEFLKKYQNIKASKPTKHMSADIVTSMTSIRSL